MKIKKLSEKVEINRELLIKLLSIIKEFDTYLESDHNHGLLSFQRTLAEEAAKTVEVKMEWTD